MATWNRNVSYDANKGYLVVSNPASGANPPPVPGKGNRADSADEITTYSEDRPATVNYNAQGSVVLTGLSAKPGSTAPGSQVRGNGNLLVVTDDGATGSNYSYHVVGTVDGVTKETEDPQIHNLGG